MIAAVAASGHGVLVSLDDNGTLELSWQWLRDHARDADSYLASANQRIVSAATVAAAGAADVSIDDDGHALIVRWPGGPTTSFSFEFLRTLGAAAGQIRVADIVPWTGQQLGARLTTIGADDIAEDDGLRRALAGLAADGAVLVSGVPPEPLATRRVIERFGYVRTTIFGDVWEFGSDGALADSASSRLAITPHTDATYSNDAPGLLALHCLVYDATGGENVLVDGHAIAAEIAADNPAHLATLRSVDIAGQYVGDGVHLVAARPVLRQCGDRLAQISYNHHDRAPMLLPEPEMSELYAALHHFDALANDPAMQYDVALRPGDMVVIDNWRVLHGRRAFCGERRLAGGYVNREDVDSTARMMLRGRR